jgi:hypothetical protein
VNRAPRVAAQVGTPIAGAPREAAGSGRAGQAAAPIMIVGSVRETAGSGRAGRPGTPTAGWVREAAGPGRSCAGRAAA